MRPGPSWSGIEQGDMGIDETGILQRLDPARAREGEKPDQLGQLRLLMRPFSCISSRICLSYDRFRFLRSSSQLLIHFS